MSRSAPARLEALHLQDSAPGVGGVCRRSAVQLDEVAPDHHADQPGDGDVGDRQVATLPAVTQDRDPVADVGDLLEPVRDVDDRHGRRAFSAAMIANSRPVSRSVSAEVGSSMITSRGVERQRLGDLDHLLLGDAQLLDRGLRVDRERRRARAALAAHRLGSRSSIDAQPGQRLRAQKEVLGDVQVRRLAERPGR